MKTLSILKANFFEHLSLLIFSMGTGLLACLQIYFYTVYKFSVMQSSILLASATVGQLLGSLLSKRLVVLCAHFVKRFNIPICSMRLAILISAFSVSILFFTFPFINNFYLFIALCLHLGIFLTTFSPINMTLLTADIHVDNAATVTAWRRLMINFGAALAFVLIGYAENKSYILFNCLGSIFFIIAIAQVFYLFKSNHITIKIKSSMSNLTLVHNSRGVCVWLTAVFISFLVFYQTISTYPIYLNDYANINASQFSQLLILSAIVIIALQFITLFLEKILSISAISTLGSLLMGFGISLIFIPTHIAIILSVIVWSLGEILLLGVTPIYAKIFAGNDKDKNLRYSSNYYAVCYLGKILGPVGGGFIYSHAHWHASLLLVILGMSIFAAVCFWYLGAWLEKPSSQLASQAI